MATLILVFKTDVWHTRANNELVGIFTDRDKLIKQIKKHPHFSAWDIDFMFTQNQNQTQQGSEEYLRDYELIIETWEADAFNNLNLD